MTPSRDRLGSAARALFVSALFLLATPVIAQQDPVNNFCRRFGHQTAVVDNRLYIDGGLINWNLQDNPSNYTNTYLLYNDLSSSAPNVGMPPLYANLSKNGTVPSTNGGALWADNINKRLYLFGGEHNLEPPTPFNLWSYDILNNQWDSLGSPRSGVPINKVSYGAGVSVSSRGEAYYYGGWLSNTSVLGWGTGPPIATNGLVKYSMDSNTWSNTSGPADNMRRAEGSLHYIPAGGGGVLVYFGGIQDPSANGSVTGQPMDTIFVYDILSSKWYSQKATGTVPEMRRRFCAGVTWANDFSSYNIYMYGGATVPGDSGAGYDDVYVLTMPTFTWIKMFPLDRNGTGDNPHHSLSCNIVQNRAQMIIIGGTFPSSDQCDYPVQWGTHNVDLGKQNPNKSIWELYSPNKTTYSVPDEILSVVGGNGDGGATKTVPANGWDNADIRVMMTQKATIDARVPTRAVGATAVASPSSGLSTGAIAGIVVGAGLVVIALVGVCCCLMISRCRKRRQYNEQQPGPYHIRSMSEQAWSPPPHPASPFSSPPYNHSPFQPPPPPQSTSPVPAHGLSVPPHMGPPAELPSESPPPSVPTSGLPTPGLTPSIMTPGMMTPGASTMPLLPTSGTMAPPSMGRASSVTYPPHHNNYFPEQPPPQASPAPSPPPQQTYFPETMTLTNQVQVDANGNMWVPQVSMVQIASGSQTGGTPPVYTPPTGDRKSPQPPPPPPVDTHPSPPVELPPHSPQELSADHFDRGEQSGAQQQNQGQGQGQNQTYYNR